MTCGKGGYVRSIARDLGRGLGCLGHVTWLRRLWSGPFRAEDGVTLDEVERLARTEEIDALLRPLEEGLAGLPELRCPEASVARLRNGNPAMVWPGEAEFGDLAWVSHDGKAVAVGQVRGAELHPVRVFAAEAANGG
jgi:tRNA pseudouridine55 synthase